MRGACSRCLTSRGRRWPCPISGSDWAAKSVTRVLDTLTGEGVLIYHSNTVQKSGDKTEKMLALDMEAGEAMARISRRSPARLDVVSVLADGGWMSQKELVYMTSVTDAALRDMVKKGILRARQEERLRTPDFSEVSPAPLPVLSAQQQQAYDGLAALMDENAPRAALLFGVTGSGKTQVYLKLIAHALEQGKSAIVLVPEIGLTPQVMRQFAAQFGDTVAVLHSALSAGERYDSFKKIKSSRARVVIGTRSAVFAPVEHLGVLILDEEQDGAYKSEQSPRYHARDVAKYRAAHEGALLVLGSATPSVETYYGAKQGKYPVFSLTERFMGTSLPEVQIADLRGQAREGRSGVIGQQLESELIDTLQKGKQAILFLNRRGNSRVIGCALCGWVPECPSCSTSMTYHSASGRAMCHYCGASVKITGTCPVCGGTSLFTETPGTQKVEQELHEKFPSARRAAHGRGHDDHQGRARKAAGAVCKGRRGHPAWHPDGDQGAGFRECDARRCAGRGPKPVCAGLPRAGAHVFADYTGGRARGTAV